MKKIFYLVIILLTVFSCAKTDDKTKALKQTVTEWMGKTIIFPDKVTCSYMGTDTVYSEKLSAPYKILTYTDSTGCSSCKLKLSTWKYYIQEADSIMPGKVEFLFYFQPKNPRELIHILRQEDFGYPVYIDRQGEINKKNNFPDEMELQCFLLNSNNEVVSIGNPSLNPQIWELYKKIITQDENGEIQKSPDTSVHIEKSEIELRGLKVGETSEATFKLKNTGNHPLLISHVDTSCGCTVPYWKKKPVTPGGETEIKVEVKPDNHGYFNKAIQVYMNTQDKVVSLTVRGTTQ